MVGYSDYANMPGPLVEEMAGQGNARAIFELRRRGMQVPRRGVWAPPTVAPGMGMAGRPRVMPNIEQPAYLQRGVPGLQTIAEPPQMATIPAMPESIQRTQDPALAFGNTGRALAGQDLPGIEAPPYLQRGVAPRRDSGEDRLARIAAGGDVAGTIQAGAAAADEVAGETAPAALQGPLGPMAAAMADLEDEPDDKYGSHIDQILQELMGGKDPKANRNMALAQAGFAMAASGSPFFFQAVGQGGQAGLKAYQDAEKEDMLRRVRAAEIAQGQQTFGETKRSNRADEAYKEGVLTETKRSNMTTEQQKAIEFEETKRRNRVEESINRGQLAISGQNATIALENLRLVQEKFRDEQQRYQDGLADEKAYKKAQTEYTKALAASQAALGVDRATDIVYTQDGGASIVDMTTGKAAPITDADGNPIKAVPKAASATALQKNAAYLAGLGVVANESDAAKLLVSAKAWTPEQRMARANQMAQDRLLAHPELIGPEADAAVQQWTAEFQQMFENAGGAAPAAATPSAAPPVSSEAPAGAAPAGGVAIGTTATNPQTKEKVRWDGKNWVPVK